MYRRYISLRNSILFVFVLMALALTACGPETLVVGLEPTPTTTPLPTPVVMSYVNDEYGFTFRYPETWTLAEEPHLVKLSQGTLILSIAHGWASNPGFSPMGGRTGIPAGDFIYGGKIFFLEQVIPAQVLEYERKDKMISYGGTGLVKVGDLVFNIWLEDVDSANYSELDIPKELQAEVREILESFERIEATGRPPAPTPTPAPFAEKDIVTYVNDDYWLAFVYPSNWALEEIPAGQEVPGGESATTLHLTKGALRLAIQFKGAEEATVLGASGRPAGEVEERGTVTILGREIPKQVLVHEGKVKSVFLADRFDDLELYVQLDDGVGAETAYEAIDIPESAQSAMEAILSSLTRTGELKSFGPDTLTYENTSYGFSFQYPASWTVQEVAGETVDTDSQVSKLADAVALRQGKFAIVVQYQHKSDPAQIAWGGSLVPGGLAYAEATLGDRVTLLGEETYKHVWTYNGGIKAISVNNTGKSVDLLLSITLADSSVMLIQDAEAETIPESAIAALDQVLSSFAVTQ
jgi:hypothetical protein